MRRIERRGSARPPPPFGNGPASLSSSPGFAAVCSPLSLREARARASRAGLILTTVTPLLILLLLLGNLILRLLQSVVLEVKDLLEAVWLLAVAVASEGVENFWEFSLANDRVLDLTNLLVSEDDVALVDAQFEGQEEDRD